MGEFSPIEGRGFPKRGAFSPDIGRVVDFLRARHPERTAEHVAALTGENIETVRKWLKRRNGIGGPAILRLLAAYRLDLLKAAFPSGLSWAEDLAKGAATEEELARADHRSLIARLAAIEARLAALDQDEDRARPPSSRARDRMAGREDRALGRGER